MLAAFLACLRARDASACESAVRTELAQISCARTRFARGSQRPLPSGPSPPAPADALARHSTRRTTGVSVVEPTERPGGRSGAVERSRGAERGSLCWAGVGAAAVLPAMRGAGRAGGCAGLRHRVAIDLFLAVEFAEVRVECAGRGCIRCGAPLSRVEFSVPVPSRSLLLLASAPSSSSAPSSALTWAPTRTPLEWWDYARRAGHTPDMQGPPVHRSKSQGSSRPRSRPMPASRDGGAGRSDIPVQGLARSLEPPGLAWSRAADVALARAGPEI